MSRFSQEEIDKRVKEEREIRLSKLKENIEALEKAKAREEEGKSEELHDYGNEEEKQEWMKAKTQKRYSRKEHHSRSRSRSRRSHTHRRIHPEREAQRLRARWTPPGTGNTFPKRDTFLRPPASRCNRNRKGF